MAALVLIIGVGIGIGIGFRLGEPTARRGSKLESNSEAKSYGTLPYTFDADPDTDSDTDKLKLLILSL